MADLKKTVAIIFSGVDKDLGKTVNAINRSFSTLESGMMSIAEPMAKVADGVLKTDAALAVMAAGGLMLAVNESGKFADAFGEISTLFNANSIDLKGFRNDILEYSRDSRASMEDIEAAIYSAISAGIHYKDSLDFMSSAEKLSLAGKADLASTTKVLASTLNAYGAETSEVSRYSDAFFKTIEKGQTTLPELATSLSGVTGLAAAGKVPIETLTATIAALTATGAPTTEAMTGIRGILTALIKPSKEAEDTAKSLGIEFGVSALKSRGLEGVLADVQKATGGNIETMGKLFGRVQGLNAAVILASDSSGKFKGALEAINDSAGATEAAYAKIIGSYGDSNTKFLNNVKVTLIQIGDEFIGNYAKIMASAGKVAEGISTLLSSSSFAPVRKEIQAFADWLETEMNGIAKALPKAFKNVDFDELIKSIKGLGEDIGNLFGNLDLTDPEDLAKAIQFVIDSLNMLTNVTAGMAETFTPVFAAIKNIVEGFNNLDASTQKGAGNVLGAAKLIVDAGLIMAGVIVTIGQSADAVTRIFQTVSGLVVTLWNAVQISFDGLMAGIVGIAKVANELGNTLSFGLFKDKFSENLGALDAIMSDVKNDLIKNVGEFHGAAGTLWEGVAGGADKVTEAVGKTSRAVKEMPADLIDWTGAANDALSSVSKTATTTGDKVNEIFDRTTNTYVGIYPDTKSLEATKKTIDEKLPDYKLMQIQADLDIAKIKTTAETFQKSIEWKAKLDIADVEANAKILETVFGGIASVTESTGNAIGGLVSAFSDASLMSGKAKTIQDWIDREYKMRLENFELQKELTEQQLRLNDLKIESYENGEGLINIKCDGLRPELEMILYKIIDLAQVRGNAAGHEFLLGT